MLGGGVLLLKKEGATIHGPRALRQGPEGEQHRNSESGTWGKGNPEQEGLEMVRGKI